VGAVVGGEERKRPVADDSRADPLADWFEMAALSRHSGHRPWGASVARGLSHCGQRRAEVMVFAFRKGCFRLHLYQKQAIGMVTGKLELQPRIEEKLELQPRIELG
jgi:hypothetical protein